MYKIPANSLFMGKDLVFMPECHSTNSVALERCQQLPPPADGTIIITGHQLAGRGQRGNVWVANAGENLTFSVIVKPTFLMIADQFMLNVCTALAVADFLGRAGCAEVSVKWPNDVYVGNRKAAGILIECQIRGNQLVWAVIGIGLNINQKHFYVSTATSLSLESGKVYSLDDCFQSLVSLLEGRYIQLRQGATASLMKDYLGRMYWMNELHEFESERLGRFEGSISGIDRHGRLRMSIDGADAYFGVKEVVFIK